MTMEAAALWTDGRYFLQAATQLDKNWTLMKQGLPGVLSKEEWLIKTLPPKSRVGVDPQLCTAEAAKRFAEKLAEHGHQLVAVSDNLVDAVWGNDRPARASNPVFTLPVKWTGKPVSAKLEDAVKFVESKKCMALVVTELDEIAWLFNLRGSDIQFNPVFYAFAVVQKQQVTLYVEKERLLPDALASLAHVAIKPYEQIYSDLSAAKMSEEEKMYVSRGCNWALVSAIGEKHVIAGASPIQSAKAIKNEVELAGFRACHIRDGAALCNYFGWLEHELCAVGNAGIDEVCGAEKLEQFRRMQADCMGLSFDTISAVGSNAAVIHYKPERETAKLISVNEIYLCDSGGQYRDGTTDVTRTLHFGTPTQFEKEAYTRVLKGNVSLNMTVFPQGVNGYQLDCIARSALWQVGLDYRHGTGHGVGHFLNVHEGPHGIGGKSGYSEIALQEGMIVTDEPGYYEDGKFGIRLENVVGVKKAETPHAFGGVKYLTFECMTMAPFQRRLIEKKLLTGAELEWINKYHGEIREKVGPMLEPSSLGYQWMMKETEPM